jgi:hypothetical protein
MRLMIGGGLAAVPIVPMMAMAMIRPSGAYHRLFAIVHILMIDAEHAFHAADDTADRGSHDGADRTGNAVAFMKAVRGAPGNSLRLCGERHGERSKARANEQFQSHEVTSTFVGDFVVCLTRPQ